MKKLPLADLQEHSPFADNIHSRLQAMLELRLEKSSLAEITKSKCRNKYKDTLQQIFVTKNKKLRHPVFFLFLPYYVFFELAKCEYFIGESSDAFSVLQLNRETLNWSVRSSPVKISMSGSIRQLLLLYNQVERTLCEVLSDQGCHTIGQTTWDAISRYPKDFDWMDSLRIKNGSGCIETDDDKYSEADDDTDQDDFDESLSVWDSLDEITMPFYVPIWKYSEWALCFQRVFNVNFESIKKDIHQLFKLLFRPSTRQAAKEAAHICKKYENKRISSRRQTFRLSDILSSLCTIYNLRYFCEADPFSSKELQNAICLISDFCIATGQILDLETSSLDEKWVALLRYGYPEEYIPFDNFDDFFVNPNRVLVKAILLRAIAQKWEDSIHQDIQIQDWFSTAVFGGGKGNYDTVMNMIQAEIYVSLTSPKRLIHDMATLGGVKVKSDKNISSNAQYSLIDVFHRWEFWHETDSMTFSKIAMHIKKKTSCLDNIVKNLSEPFRHPQKLTLEDLDYFERTNSKRLLDRKKMIFELLPEQVQELLKDYKELDDFRYLILLCIVFSELRKRMCHQAYGLCMKFLQLG